MAAFARTLLPLCLLMACSRPVVVHPGRDRASREAAMLEALHTHGQPGDWLVIRGYHKTDNLVSAVTNSPFSHAAVLDLEREQVVEADGTGLHATALPAFVRKAHRLMIVRSQWALDAATQRAAVEKARSLVGRPYDFTGLLGINVPDRYYCSELAVAVYGHHPAHRKDHLPPVVPPDQLHYWGRVVWDSGAVAD